MNQNETTNGVSTDHSNTPQENGASDHGASHQHNHTCSEAQLLQLEKSILRQEIALLCSRTHPLRLELKALELSISRKRQEFKDLDRKLFNLVCTPTKCPPHPNGNLSKHPINDQKRPTQSLDDLMVLLKAMPKDQLKKALLGE